MPAPPEAPPVSSLGSPLPVLPPRLAQASNAAILGQLPTPAGLSHGCPFQLGVRRSACAHWERRWGHAPCSPITPSSAQAPPLCARPRLETVPCSTDRVSCQLSPLQASSGRERSVPMWAGWDAAVSLSSSLPVPPLVSMT